MTNFSGPALLLSVALVGAASCAGAPRPAPERDPSGDRLWVLAPHPDDEVLMAGELLRRAVAAHRPVTVLVMTNGDLGCERNGYLRESETIAALGVLGVSEDDVHFLGYPDGFLEVLGTTPLEPIARTQPDGTCGSGTGTYAVRGAGGIDLHRQLFGSSGAYVASGPVDDLAELLARESPREIVVAHAIDTHRDHAMTYVFLRRALERASLGVVPTLLRAVVHQGACWPNGASSEPCPDVRTSFAAPMPPFAPPLASYAPALRIASDDGGQTKRRAIASYVSQLGAPSPDDSWLSSFGRTDEVFWPETLAPDANHPGRMVRTHGGDVLTARADVSIAAEGRAFLQIAELRLTIDGDGVLLSHGELELRRVPWQRGVSSTEPHRFELRVDRRPEEGVVEVTVRRDESLSLLAVIAGDLEGSSEADFASGAERATVERQEAFAE